MVAPDATLNLRTQPMSVAFLPSSISLSTMRGCQLGSPLKSRMRAQTFSIGASMTLEILTFGTQSSLDAQRGD